VRGHRRILAVLALVYPVGRNTRSRGGGHILAINQYQY
jgi:hypothetical protein